LIFLQVPVPGIPVPYSRKQAQSGTVQYGIIFTFIFCVDTIPFLVKAHVTVYLVYRTIPKFLSLIKISFPFGWEIKFFILFCQWILMSHRGIKGKEESEQFCALSLF
jgi:hypothetical protein